MCIKLFRRLFRKKMLKCIYCEQEEGIVTFNGREHVIPKMMGTFDNSPTLINLVCDNCNSVIFNTLETKFKEDTEEGIYYQMFNFSDSAQIRIRGENVRAEFSPGLGDDFFNDIFPFFRFNDGKEEIYFVPQIKIKHPDTKRYTVLVIDKIAALPKQGKKFLKIKEFLKGTDGKNNVAIYTKTDNPEDTSAQDQAIQLLKDLDVSYKPGESKHVPNTTATKQQTFHINMDVTVGNDVGRVIAKIAYNYFAYCAQQSGMTNILIHPNFAQIKSYILGGIDLPIKDIIPRIENHTAIQDEQEGGGRFIAHSIILEQWRGVVAVHISFLGRRVYTVILGNLPKELESSNFGCAHMFDPIHHKIHGLTANPAKRGTDDSVVFGLFQKM